MTRTEMLELHDKIKENKFRENPVLNTRYAKGYYEQMEQLAKAFWEQVKDAQTDPNNPLGKISWNFIHDLYAANLKVKNFANSIEEDDYAFYQQYDALKHVTKEYEQSKLLETFYECLEGINDGMFLLHNKVAKMTEVPITVSSWGLCGKAYKEKAYVYFKEKEA